MDAFGEKPRLRNLLDHFAVIEDPREAWRVAYRLPEVLLLVVCASIASCDDFDDIAAVGVSCQANAKTVPITHMAHAPHERLAPVEKEGRLRTDQPAQTAVAASIFHRSSRPRREHRRYRRYA